MQGIVSFFEDEIRFNNKKTRNLEYSAQDLLDYIDSLADLVCLVLDPKLGAFIPQPKEFLKRKV